MRWLLPLVLIAAGVAAVFVAQARSGGGDVPVADPSSAAGAARVDSGAADSGAADGAAADGANGQPQQPPAPKTTDAFEEALARAEVGHPHLVRQIRGAIVAWCDQTPSDMPLAAVETMATVRIRPYAGGVAMAGEVAIGSFYDAATNSVFLDVSLVDGARSLGGKVSSLAIAYTLAHAFADAVLGMGADLSGPRSLAPTATRSVLAGALVRRYLIPGVPAEAIQAEGLTSARAAVLAAEKALQAEHPGAVLRGSVADSEDLDGFLTGFRSPELTCFPGAGSDASGD